jgi:hypothetical protein
MTELHVLVDGAVRLRLGAYGIDEAHAIVGQNGYPALLWPLLGDGAFGVAVTPWVVCAHVDTFDGIVGGTTALWTTAALPSPGTTDRALLVQAAAWLASVRRVPTSFELGPVSGDVSAARMRLARAVAAWPSTQVVKVS